MKRIGVPTYPKLGKRLAAIALVGILGLGAAACGSSGATRSHNAPAQNTPASSGGTPTTAAPNSGGAGF